MKLRLSKEEHEVTVQIEGDAPLAEQISIVLQQEYKTNPEELNNSEVQALASSLESAAIDTSILSALSNGVINNTPKTKYTTIYGIKQTNLKTNVVVNLNDNPVAHMKDPRCEKFCVYVHGDKTGNIIEQQRLQALTTTLECYSNVKVFYDFGKMMKHVTRGS